MLNNWTVIRYSGKPWHDSKWGSAIEVLAAVSEEASHGGSTHDGCNQLLHNGKLVVPKGLSQIAWKVYALKQELRRQQESTVLTLVEELIPYEKERKQNEN